MKFQLATAAIVCGSVVLFSAIWLNRRTRDLVLSGRRHQAGVGAVAPTEDAAGSETVDGSEWYDLDLFGPAPTGAGSRFDDTVALPIDTPRRLDAIVEAAARRLRALPEPQDLGHRTIAYRARLQRIMRDTAQARARLAAGTYGTCTGCTAPISLALLTQRPWTPLCVYCALDI